MHKRSGLLSFTTLGQTLLGSFWNYGALEESPIMEIMEVEMMMEVRWMMLRYLTPMSSLLNCTSMLLC